MWQKIFRDRSPGDVLRHTPLLPECLSVRHHRQEAHRLSDQSSNPLRAAAAARDFGFLAAGPLCMPMPGVRRPVDLQSAGSSHLRLPR